MNKYELDKYLNNFNLIDEKITELKLNNSIRIEKISLNEIKGHILKSEHNLNFVNDNIKLNYLDWAITGCYYSSYHAALSLIMTKNYTSKNHLATLLVLIKEFYKNGLNKEDIESFANLLDYHDLLFYIESKNTREDATYSTKIKFNKEDVEKLRIKSTLFVSKIKEILNT